MGRARRSLVQKLLRAAESPYFELPAGWHVMSRYRTAELFLKHPSKPPVAYSDAPLYQQLLRAYPEVKLQPLRLTSPQPSLAARFVGAQQAAIQGELAELAAAQQQAAAQQAQLGGQLPPALQQQQAAAQRRTLQDVVQDAFRQVESRADIKRELQEAGSETRAGGYIELVQEQEEAVLQAALHKHAAQEAQQAAVSKAS